MLAAGLPLRVVALSASGGYDTHDNQATELADGLKLTADSLLAFQRDLEARGLADRVLVHVWTEFGRRAKENGSGGTDHGAAGTGFLIGSRVTGTMIGEFPGLAKLDARRQPPRDIRLPRALRARFSRTGSGRTPTAIIPGRAEVQRGRRSSGEAAAAAASSRPLSRAARACARRGSRPAGPRAGVGGRVQPDALALVDPPRPGDHRARELRRGRPRSGAAAGRWDAHLSDRGGASRRTGELEASLPPGPLPLWCTLAGHRARGHGSDAAGHLSADYQLPGEGGSCPGPLIT